VRTFILVEYPFDNDDDPHVYAVNEHDVSRRFDSADYNGDAFAVFTLAKDRTRFTEVRLRPDSKVRINTDEEFPFHYATSALETAEGEFVGNVVWTDH